MRRAACNLLDVVSSSEPTSCSSLQEKDEFHNLPDWLQGRTTSLTPLLSWLPISSSQLPRTTMDLDFVVSSGEPKNEAMDIDQEQVDSCSVPAESLDSEDSGRAIALKAEILASVSTSEALRIARDIRKLCSDAGSNNEIALLSLIEPWEGDDETLSVLLSNLSDDGGSGSYNWPAHVLCSILLPKLLNLRTPASRVLLSSTVSFCKLHQVAAAEALIFPLVLRKEGINIVLCDVLTRVIKECLHKSHISAFCQKLLCGEGKDRKVVCLPCHRDLISDELVWTEPLFTLFQHILNQDVYLTPDSVEHIVFVIVDVADKFLASLKFGNFFLCFVTKCRRAASFYKVMLEKAAEKTNTFVTKSILLKLDAQ